MTIHETPDFSTKKEKPRPAFSPFGQADPAAFASLQRARSPNPRPVARIRTASPFDALHLSRLGL
jgi:hypothetical protein